MATNKVVLRTVEQVMTGYTPVYNPLYPLLLQGKSQAYDQVVGQLDFKRLTTVGDIRNGHITPKDTEIKQIVVGDGKKSFKKYFLASQFVVSQFQDQDGTEDVIAQVLDESQKHMDELLMFGEGTDMSTMVNNGIYYSNDPNYVLPSSVVNAAASAGDWLKGMHTNIMASKRQADLVAGRKILVIYGSSALAVYDSLYTNSDSPFSSTLKEALGENYTVVTMPSDITPAGANGWIIINVDQVKVNYTTLPKLNNQGSNDEKEYNWFNFLMGSIMVEVLAYGGIIRQACTFA